MATFEAEITALQGNVLAPLVNFRDLAVTIPISEPRTATLSLSVYDPAAGELYSFDGDGNLYGALSRMLRIRYRGTTIFWGILQAPKYSAGAKRVTINAHDPSLRLKRRQLNYGDDVVGPSDGPAPHNPADYRTMRDIYAANYNTESQYDVGVPDIGILNGTNDAVEAPAEFWVQIERGSNTFDKLQEVGRGPYGAEWTLSPRDPEVGELPFTAVPISTFVNGNQNAPAAGGWDLMADATGFPDEGVIRLDYERDEDGVLVRALWRYDSRTDASFHIVGYHPLAHLYDSNEIKAGRGERPYRYAHFDTFDFMGANRTGALIAVTPTENDAPEAVTIRFAYDDTDQELHNCRDFEWAPDGEATRNQFVGVVAASDPDARGLRAICRTIASWLHIGIFSAWESVNGANVKEVSQDNLTGYAAIEVERYSRPPNDFKVYPELEPAEGWPAEGEPGWRPMFLRDYFLGDRILARYRQGYVNTGDIVGRIMQVKVSQADLAGNAAVDLECVPHVAYVGDVTCEPAWVPTA